METARHKFERGRRNVTRACRACRQRRIRCTAGRPCQPCRAKAVECVEDSGLKALDRRAYRLGMDNSRTLLRQKAILDNLLSVIRNGTAENAMKCIQNGASLEEIAEILELAHGSPDQKPVAEKNTNSPEKSPGENESPMIVADSRLETLIKSRMTSHRILGNFGNLPFSSGLKTIGLTAKTQTQQIRNLSRPVWECLPLISDDASCKDPFSLAVFSFRNLARQQIAAGGSPDLILSSQGMNVDLLFRSRKVEDPHTVANWASELAKTFVFLPMITKLAAADVLACLMRWLIAPTKEHYLALPPTSRPLEEQLFMPHSIGIDILTFAELRRSLLTRNDRDWLNSLTPTTMDFNWPYSEDACCERDYSYVNGQTPSIRLSKPFMEHVRNVDNFSMHRDILKVFPEFEDKFRFHTSLSSDESPGQAASYYTEGQ